jgi:hypothetical protein
VQSMPPPPAIERGTISSRLMRACHEAHTRADRYPIANRSDAGRALRDAKGKLTKSPPVAAAAA